MPFQYVVCPVAIPAATLVSEVVDTVPDALVCKSPPPSAEKLTTPESVVVPVASVKPVSVVEATVVRTDEASDEVAVSVPTFSVYEVTFVPVNVAMVAVVIFAIEAVSAFTTPVTIDAKVATRPCVVEVAMMVDDAAVIPFVRR